MNEHKVDKSNKYKNPFVMPVLSIAFLLIITMTVSYGYYTVSNSLQKANGNVTMPQKCVLTFDNATAQVTINRSDLSMTSAKELAATATAYVRLNGDAACSCTYNVLLYSEGDTYTKSSATPGVSIGSEFYYNLKGNKNGFGGSNAISPNSDVNGDFSTLTSGTRVGYGTIKVVSTGTQVSHTWIFGEHFEVFPQHNQIAQQGKTFKYSLRFQKNSCTF